MDLMQNQTEQGPFYVVHNGRDYSVMPLAEVEGNERYTLVSQFKTRPEAEADLRKGLESGDYRR
jgi:hypothetical protein